MTGKRLFHMLALTALTLFSAPSVYGDTTGAGRGGSLAIEIRENLKKPFVLKSYTLSLNDRIVAQTGAEASGGAAVFQEALAPGTYPLFAEAAYAGSGYGIYSADTYPVAGEYTVQIRAGFHTVVTVTFNDEAGFLQGLKSRPFISFLSEELPLSVPVGVPSGGAPGMDDVESGLTETSTVAAPPALINAREDLSAEVIEAALLTHIRVASDEGGTRVILRGDGSFERYDHALLENPARIVVDLIGVRRSIAAPLPHLEKGALKKVLIKRGSPESSRVILYFQKGGTYDYRIEKRGNTLQVFLK